MTAMGHMDLGFTVVHAMDPLMNPIVAIALSLMMLLLLLNAKEGFIAIAAPIQDDDDDNVLALHFDEHDAIAETSAAM